MGIGRRDDEGSVRARLLRLLCICVCVCVWLGLQRKGNMILVGFRGPHTRSMRDLAVKFKMASWRVKEEGGGAGGSFICESRMFFHP